LGHENTLKLWDTATGALIRTFEGHIARGLVGRVLARWDPRTARALANVSAVELARDADVTGYYPRARITGQAFDGRRPMAKQLRQQPTKE
jgi:hypothetical protein